MAILGKYSFGIGDRFGQQGYYLLKAFKEAQDNGINATPVWNKSNREHKTVKTQPFSVRVEAEKAAQIVGWKEDYLVDADHITYETVDAYLDSSDFYTIDVANKIGVGLTQTELDLFLSDYHGLLGELNIEGIDDPFEITNEILVEMANRFYKAIKEAKRIYEKISKYKKGKTFSVEISMDEVEQPQNPLELYFILFLASQYHIPVNTIAPKFTGQFNKGTDYEGDLAMFESEFERDILVIAHCVKKFDLPENLKLSVHTGSDKFSIYPVINKLVKKHNSGVHLKTAGTTWLEELTGLAASDESGLKFAKAIYDDAYNRYDELTGPYGSVLSIKKDELPTPEEVHQWDKQRFTSTLRHNQQEANFNPSFRQLIHTAYKIAAEKSGEYHELINSNAETVGEFVKDNILNNHLKPLFK